MARTKQSIPFKSIAEIFQAARAADARAQGELKVEILMGIGSTPDQIRAVKEAFVPETSHASVLVWDLNSRAEIAPDADCGLVVVLVGDQTDKAKQIVTRCSVQGVSCVLISSTALELPALDEAEEIAVDTVVGTDYNTVQEQLAQCLALNINRIGLAANFPFMREEVAQVLMQESAAANAGVGALAFIPGSDFPLMVVQQEKLALDLMGAYGKSMSTERLVDMVGVVGIGTFWRYIARSVAGLVPGFGWLIKAAIAYSGTLADGKAIQAHLTGNVDLTSQLGKLKDLFVTVTGEPNPAVSAKPAEKKDEPVIVALDHTLPDTEEVEDDGEGYITLD